MWLRGRGPIGLSVSPNGDMTVASGSAQKGPFIAGSTVTLNVLSPSTFVYQVDASGLTVSRITSKVPVLSQTGKSFTLETDNSGIFKTDGLVFTTNENLVQASVDGYYFDEITGARSTSPLALRGVIDISKTSLNVNILTDLSRARILKLAREACPTPLSTATAACTLTSDQLSAVIDKAEREVLTAFNVPTGALGTQQKRFADMNFKNIANTGILSSPSAADQLLLSISALVMQIGREAGGVTEFINAFEADIEDDGLLGNADLKNMISRASTTVSFSKVAQNMNAFYKTNKYVAADLQKWVDPSGGVLGVIAGQSEFYNLSVGAFTKQYPSTNQSYKASGPNGNCLQVVSKDASSILTVGSTSTAPTTTLSTPVYVASNTTVTYSVATTPTNFNGSAKVVAWDATALNSCALPTGTLAGTVPSIASGIYYFAATPPGLSNFTTKFIADFGKCFNLTVTNRVRASDLSNPDMPEATDVSDLCKPLAGSPSQSYLNNGYNAGQQFYWLLSDGSMSKTARITEVDVTDYYVGKNGQPVAKMLFKFMDRYNRMSSLGVYATQDGNLLSSNTSGWYNMGNQQPVDINLLVGARKYTSIPLRLATDRTLNDVKIMYRSAFIPSIRADGPGMVLPDNRKLTAVKVEGPGLPLAGLVYIPPLQKGQTDFDFSNMEGTLPDGRPQNQLKRCGFQPVPTAGVWPAVPATCGINWVGATPWLAPNTVPTSTTKVSDLRYTLPTTVPSFGSAAPAGISLPTLTINSVVVTAGQLMTKGTEYQFSLYYDNNSTPVYVYTKRLNTSMPTFNEVHAMNWINLETVGTVGTVGAVNIQNLSGTNAFEGLRPGPNQTTLDVSWTGQLMNALEVTSINTNLQRAHYPRATPGDAVARGLSYGTLAPQLDQDGISLPMQWSEGKDSLTGEPIISVTSTTTPPVVSATPNLSRTISFSLRTWDGSWKSQDYFIETYPR